MDDGFEEILARFDPEVRNLAIGARSLIEAVYPEVVEVPWPPLASIRAPNFPTQRFC